MDSHLSNPAKMRFEWCQKRNWKMNIGLKR